ncbi:acyltransferase [Puia sp.]|jgi:peptidoglycan/LPS O-acetylase OafA/YrhL|uniref:acyltransferase family protein n=1 Tax=Puia sp. TaxID=2045100 RepID=UPI002F42D9FF
MRKIYFPGLDGIRAIACIMVFFGHFNGAFGIRTLLPEHLIGSNGVTCFFTLSGFLITSLLLQEKRATGKINRANFYLRRILRIWPLYFLIIAIGWLTFPYVQGTDERPAYFLYYLFFAGNYAFAAMRGIWIINPLWSVAVEEQFYSFWPAVVDSPKVLRSCGVILATFLVIKFVARDSSEGFYYFIRYTRIDCMAIGGIIACLKFRDSALLRPLLHPLVQWTCWGLFAYAIFRPLHLFSFVDDEVFSAITAILILNVATNPRTVLTLENPVLKYLGRISYGIYAYNLPVLYLWLVCIPGEKTRMLPQWTYTLPFLLLGINVLVAHLSYHLFEKRFLKVRVRFGHLSSPMVT